MITAWLMMGALAVAQDAPVAPRPIVEYVRADPDGSKAERVVVYMPAPDRVEVFKHRDRCESAAWVIGEVDRARRSTVRLDAGRLLPGARRQSIGALRHADEPARIILDLARADGTHSESVRVAAGPWHDYDFDLASLSAVFDGEPAPHAAFRFAMPLVWTGKGALLQNLGTVTLRFVREESFAGRAAARYQASGSDARFRGGPLWLDRDQGFVLGARWGSPNHGEYSAFHLTVSAVRPGGAAAWRDALIDHWRDCPAAE